MGLGYAFRNLVSGNFENAFNGLFSSDDLLAAQDQAGDALSRKIQEQQASGLISEDQALQLYTELAPNSNSDAYWSSMGNTPLQEFGTALSEEAQNIGGFGSSAINKILGLGFKAIPWQIWILAFILVAIWLYPLWKPFAVRYLTGLAER